MLGFSPLASASLADDSVYVDVTASAACLATTSASGTKVKDGITSLAASSTASAFATIVTDGFTSLACSASVSAQVVAVIPVSSNVTSFVSTSATVNKIKDNATAVVSASSASASGIALRRPSALVRPILSTTANTAATFVGIGVAAAKSAVSATSTRTTFSAAQIHVQSLFAANAIEKWEPNPATPEAWTPVASSSKTWQDAA